MKALVVAEHVLGNVKNTTRNIVSAALKCTDEVHILILGHQIEEAVKAVKEIKGVKKVIAVNSKFFQYEIAEYYQRQIEAIAKNYTHILFAASTSGKAIAPRLAAALDLSQISEVTNIKSECVFERPIYAGSLIAEVQSNESTKIITVRCSAFELSPDGGDATVEWHEPLEFEDLAEQIQYIERCIAKESRVQITEAKIVVSGGRALASEKNFTEVLMPLAEKLNAGIGASRAAVDAGYAPNDWQVGQTGKIIAPDLYIACGISGAIQHLAGMKDSKVIVAINNDKDAPIFSVADFGIVDDLFNAIPELTSQL